MKIEKYYIVFCFCVVKNRKIKNKRLLTKTILEILNNPALAKKTGENGKKLVEAEFSGEKVAEGFIKMYNEIIGEIGYNRL